MRGSGGKKQEWTDGRWLGRFFAAAVTVLVLAGAVTIILDPFFHYHRPLSGFYYELSDQRYQNDGITRHFDYDSIITGTSMVENFKTTQFDDRFGTRSVKLPYPGATFREIDDNLKRAFSAKNDIAIVMRGLDYSHLVEDPEELRTDMGVYPKYLYDNNPFNDVKYLFNRDAVFSYELPMILRRVTGRQGGMTSFDEYGASKEDEYSADRALSGHTQFHVKRDESSALDESEKEMLLKNVNDNVIETAKLHPDTTFILFYTPYSAVWYGELLEEGGFGRQLEAERLSAVQMLEVPNIRLFSFSADPLITADLSEYKDPGHYSPAVAAMLIDRMASGENELTKENLDEYLRQEERLYREMDYNALTD